MNSTTGKSDRLLQIYSRLVNGEVLSKKEMADKFHITERSVQRDVEALRCFFSGTGPKPECHPRPESRRIPSAA